MLMNATVLIPVEADTWTGAFVAELRHLLGASGNRAVLLHVVPDLTEIHPGDARRLLAEAQELLNACAGQLGLPQDRVRLEIQMGNPKTVIPQQAILAQAQLVAMTTHARKGIGRLIEGSIAEHVMRVCHCPTLLVHLESALRDPGKAGRRVLVPIDISIDSSEIVDTLGGLLDPTGTEIVIYHDHLGASETDPVDHTTRAYRFIVTQRQRLLAAGFKVTMASAAFTSPAADIAKKIRELDVDMVAMTTHGSTGLSRLVFGSVTESVLHHSDCPLLAVSRSPTHDLTYREEYLG